MLAPKRLKGANVPKRVYQPSKKKRKRSLGFRVRSRSKSGLKVLKRRRLVKRKRLSV